jgi:hypothetical protein
VHSHDWDCPGCGICDGEIDPCDAICDECGCPLGDEPGECDCYAGESPAEAHRAERRQMGLVDF